jgi:periplasmic copper chaperone A
MKAGMSRDKGGPFGATEPCLERELFPYSLALQVNKGQVDDRLVSATIGHGILFQLLDVTGSGTASVKTIVIPAGQTIQLHARSSHIAVISNSSPFFEGSTVPGTLTFERTGPIAIDFEIGG